MEEVPPGDAESRPSALLSAPQPLGERIPQRALRVVQVRQRVTIRPTDAPHRVPDRASRLDGAQQLRAPIAEREPPARIEPDLMADLEPMFLAVHIGAHTMYHAGQRPVKLSDTTGAEGVATPVEGLRTPPR